MTRLLAACILCAAGAVSATSPPEPVPLDADTTAWIKAQAPKPSEADLEVARAIAADGAAIVEARMQAEAPAPAAPAGVLTRIFVSQSLTREELRAAFQWAAEEPNTVVVFRGLLPGTKLIDFQKVLTDILGPFAHLAAPPKIQLDPPAFTRAGIEQVPAVALVREDTVLAVVHGMIAPTWLRDQVARGRKGVLPQQGPTRAIAEPDLVAVMKQRLADVDWKAWRQSQVAGLGRSLQQPGLPAAERTQVRFHDPSFEVTTEVLAGDVVLARPGDRINPLERVAFLQEVIVIDATDPRQMRAAERWIASATGRVTLITTRAGGDAPLSWLAEEATRIGRPIFAWRADLGDALGIQRVPSRVTAEGNRFRIHEYHPDELEGDHADPQTTR